MNVIYRLDTGEVVSYFKGEPDAVALNTPEGCAAMPYEGDMVEAYVENGQVVPVPPARHEYMVFDYTKREYVDTRTDEDFDRIARDRRDGLLAATDWTQMPDIPEATREKYREYRQRLRDVPQQPNYPRQIHWPTEP